MNRKERRAALQRTAPPSSAQPAAVPPQSPLARARTAELLAGAAPKNRKERRALEQAKASDGSAMTTSGADMTDRSSATQRSAIPKGSAAAAESLRCSACGMEKPPADFSRKMLTKPKAKWRCTVCIAQAPPWAGGSGATSSTAAPTATPAAVLAQPATAPKNRKERRALLNTQGTGLKYPAATAVASPNTHITAAPKNRKERRALEQAQEAAAGGATSTQAPPSTDSSGPEESDESAKTEDSGEGLDSGSKQSSDSSDETNSSDDDADGYGDESSDEAESSDADGDATVSKPSVSAATAVHDTASIAVLERKKKEAAESEDYETAAKLKKQIEDLRAQQAAAAAQAAKEAERAKKAEAAAKKAKAAKKAQAAKAAAKARAVTEAAKRRAEQIASLEKKKLAAAAAEEYEQAAKYKKEIEKVRAATGQ